jgi:hypothetical protein
MLLCAKNILDSTKGMGLEEFLVDGPEGRPGREHTADDVQEAQRATIFNYFAAVAEFPSPCRN